MTTTTSTSPPTESPNGLYGKLKGGVADYWHHIRLFSRNARLYLIGSFLMGVNFHVFQLLLNLYLKELGFDESQIGFVVSSRAIGMTIIAIPAAILMSALTRGPLSTV